MDQHQFEIDSALVAGSGRLMVRGELDIATVPRVQAAVDTLLAQAVSQVIIDLSGVGFVDSSGLRLFIVLDQRARAEGWTLSLLRPGKRAMTVFEVSGAEGNLPFVENHNLV